MSWKQEIKLDAGRINGLVYSTRRISEVGLL